MDTGIIVLLVVVVLVLIALVAVLPKLRAAKEEQRLQGQRREVAGRHHAEADQKLAHAEEIERRAEAERAEVELAERQAEARRAEVDMAERKAAAARAEANVSRSEADRTERGLADDEIGIGRDRHDETGEVREERTLGHRDAVDEREVRTERFAHDERPQDDRIGTVDGETRRRDRPV
jgi:hypothetical protein